MPTLFIVATPIGNLQDVSQRTIETLKGVDLILCEDTRMTQRLLDRYEIKTPTISYHQHSKIQRIDYLIGLLKAGKDLALVSDAGTPGISDPGNKLIESIIGELGEKVKIVPIPGPSAVAAAASVSGFPMDSFLFLGFPPAKNKRKKFFEEIVNSKCPVIFYESPYRIIKSLTELDSQYTKCGIQDTKLVVCRELTKKFETIYRGMTKEVIEKIEKGVLKGEFAVVVNNSER